jgi:hypothetical protein
MTRIPLVCLAHARSGDKGNSANIGVVAYEPEVWPILVEQVTAERVKEHFVMLYEALDGGGTVSLRTDAQGKVLSTALLRMEVDVPEELAARFAGRGFVPSDWEPAGS